MLGSLQVSKFLKSRQIFDIVKSTLDSFIYPFSKFGGGTSTMYQVLY